MSLIEETLTGTINKVEIAIKRIQSFAPADGSPLFVAFSGGKDSQCIYHLCEMAGVKFDAHYSVTSVDPPELIRFMKKNYPDVIWDYHRWPDGRRKTMWNIIEAHTIPPTRQARYCCSELKETGGKGRVVVTGVRWAESAKRKAIHGVAEIRTTAKKLHKQAEEGDSVVKKTKRGDSIVFMDDNSTSRNMVEQCYAKKKTTVNPIIDWTEEDVWEFLNDVVKVPHCELYDEGWTRLGCIGCPLQGRKGMLRDFERWPRYKQKYIKAFDRMIANHPGEIKVASGELAPANGGVQRYTQDGSCGTPDGESVHRSNESGAGGGAGPQTSGGPTEKRASDGEWKTTSDVLAPGKQDQSGRRENETDSEREQKQENARFDQWNGQQVYDLWMWSFRDDKNEPPPHKLVPNRYSTSGRWNEKRYETYNKLINDESGD